MLRALGLQRLFAFPRSFRVSANALRKTNTRPLPWQAPWRIVIAVLVMLVFSAQSFALCAVCDPTCCYCTPIIIDVGGHGFHLTSAANGVVFDISGTGRPVQISWTAPGVENAFLVLPASDGLVHGGKELFGNFTTQPESNDPNGFRALAVYDLPENGGNGDGIIDARDRIYSSLRLWVDADHDGICRRDELYTLPALGVNSISLDYKLSWKADKYGNRFRYRSDVDVEQQKDSAIGHVAYDVALISVDNSLKSQVHWHSDSVLGQTLKTSF